MKRETWEISGRQFTKCNLIIEWHYNLIIITLWYDDSQATIAYFIRSTLNISTESKAEPNHILQFFHITITMLKRHKSDNLKTRTWWMLVNVNERKLAFLRRLLQFFFKRSCPGLTSLTLGKKLCLIYYWLFRKCPSYWNVSAGHFLTKTISTNTKLEECVNRLFIDLSSVSTLLLSLAQGPLKYSTKGRDALCSFVVFNKHRCVHLP